MLKYDNSEGLTIWFDAYHSKPEPNVGHPGGWELFLQHVLQHDQDGNLISEIKDMRGLHAIRSSLSNLDWDNMEKIAEKEYVKC